jgi:hypothetical protein
MKPFYKVFLIHFCLITGLLFLNKGSIATPLSCTPGGDQVTYGTNNVWMGYVYQGQNFNNYKGYITEGTASSMAFDESFGGNQVSYATNGCPAYTDTFSVRYKITKSFSNGYYTFTVGGDDGIRLSLDGGATWVINQWVDQGYTTYNYTVNLTGTYNIVFEYYEHFGLNRASFSVVAACIGNGDPSVYGTGNVWQGYLYQGMNFNLYKGYISEGNTANMSFDESFIGNAVNFSTSNCSVYTEQFSARFRLRKVFPAAQYMITIGGDDGYRFSIDGGVTWVINKWQDQGYNITTYTVNLSGTYNMVLEYYENGGANRISFNISNPSILPVKLSSWSVVPATDGKNQLKWKTQEDAGFDHYIIQRSTDEIQYSNIHTVGAQLNNNIEGNNYSYTDQIAYTGNLFYRLAMVEKDGSISYSSVAKVSMQTGSSALKIYPTIVEDGYVTIQSGVAMDKASIALYDINGSCLMNKSVNFSGNQLRVALQSAYGSSLRAGAYILRISKGNDLIDKKIITIK